MQIKHFICNALNIWSFWNKPSCKACYVHKNEIFNYINCLFFSHSTLMYSKPNIL